MKKLRKLICILMLLTILFMTCNVFAVENEILDTNNILNENISLDEHTQTSDEYYIGSTDEHERKENCLSGVTEEMCKPEYWKDKTIIDWEEKIISKNEIKKLNQDIVDGSGTMVFDLTQMKTTFDADARRNSLASTAIPTRNLYINGQLIDNQTYFGNLKTAMQTTGFTGTQNVIYAVCANRTDLKSWPIDDVIGYTATDRDDEMESSALNLNDPFIIYGKCVVNQNTYYWGYCNNCTGWVNAKNIAICNSKDEWLDYWKVDIENDNFIVTTGSRINLKKGGSDQIGIMLGTILKIVPENEIPEELKDKLDSNYVVYFAGKDENGFATKKYALISKNLELNKGFLDVTQKNILKVAFSCLGDEYGWGGMNGNMDCSLYTRQIYRCFGMELPRNTTWQQKTPNKFVDISKMTDDEKTKYLSTLPAGSLLYFPGHTMVYIGMDKNKNFVVSDLGQACDEEDGSELQDVYSVNINSINVKRKNGKTWLNNLTGAIVFSDKIDINDCKINIDEEDTFLKDDLEVPKISVSYNNHLLYENINYSIAYTEDKEKNKINIDISGINNFTNIYNTDVTPKTYTYNFIENGWANFTEGGISNYSFRIDGDDKRFESLSIGEINLVKDEDYIVKHGSTIITLTDKGNAKLNKLAPWDYNVNVKFKGIGEVVGKLTIASVSSNKNANIDDTSTAVKDITPKTGTKSTLNYAIVTMLLSEIGIYALYKKLWEKKL